MLKYDYSSYVMKKTTDLGGKCVVCFLVTFPEESMALLLIPTFFKSYKVLGLSIPQGLASIKTHYSDAVAPLQSRSGLDSIPLGSSQSHASIREASKSARSLATGRKLFESSLELKPSSLISNNIIRGYSILHVHLTKRTTFLRNILLCSVQPIPRPNHVILYSMCTRKGQVLQNIFKNCLRSTRFRSFL
ncbi:hypothetical protein Dimus_002162 [Dionaea muscipula]